MAVAVITGGTKGIGYALVRQFASEGFDIAFCARTTKDVNQLTEELKEEFGIRICSVQIDMTKKEEVTQFSKRIDETFEVVDVLINNAGVFAPDTFLDSPDGFLEAMMNTNVYSAYFLTRFLAHKLMQSKKPHVFNMCSVAGLKAYPNGTSYSITKFALNGFTKAIREELKNHGVNVTAVFPGATLTPSWEGVDLPAERFMPAEDVAKLIYETYMLSQRSCVEEIVLRPQLGDI